MADFSGSGTPPRGRESSNRYGVADSQKLLRLNTSSSPIFIDQKGKMMGFLEVDIFVSYLTHQLPFISVRGQIQQQKCFYTELGSISRVC